MAFNQVIKTGIITLDMKDDFEFIDLARLAIHLKVKDWKEPVFEESYNRFIKLRFTGGIYHLIIYPDMFNDIFLIIYMMIKTSANTPIRISTSNKYSVIFASDFVDMITDLIIGYDLCNTKLFGIIINTYATAFIRDHMIKKNADESYFRILNREIPFTHEKQDLEILQTAHDSWWDIYYQPASKK